MDKVKQELLLEYLEKVIAWGSTTITPVLLDGLCKFYEDVLQEHESEDTGPLTVKPFSEELINTIFRNMLTQTRSCIPRLHYRENTCKFDLKKLVKIYKKEKRARTERFEEYVPGGYMPITIGQVIGPKKNYKIIRKLGWGVYSTVWLAKSRQHRNVYCAMKIAKSAYLYKKSAKKELQLLARTKLRDTRATGHSKIIKYQDYFYARSANGQHLCIAFELMGPSLHQLIRQSNFHGLEQDGVKNIILQVLRGLVYLHDKCKIIHTDIKPENILIVPNELYIQNMIEEVTYFNKLGVEMPKTYVNAVEWMANIFTQPAKPEADSRVNTLNASNSCPEITTDYELKEEIKSRLTCNKYRPMLIDPNIKIKIADLGCACRGHEGKLMIQTVPYRALEVIIGSKYSYPVDMWSVACVAFELCTGHYLFNPYTSGYLNSPEKHLKMILEVLAEIPPHIALSGERSEEYFLSSGALKGIDMDSDYYNSIEDKLITTYEWNEDDARALGGFVELLLEPDQELRITAAGALDCSWLSS